MTYAVEALMEIGSRTDVTDTLMVDILVVLGAGVVALGLAAMTLQRRSE